MIFKHLLLQLPDYINIHKICVRFEEKNKLGNNNNRMILANGLPACYCEN
jgi:hypothetical protein